MSELLLIFAGAITGIVGWELGGKVLDALRGKGE